MRRLIGSFLIRWWYLGRAERRIEIEHVQSGERQVVPSLTAADAWMTARLTARPHTPPAPADERPAEDAGSREDDQE